MKLASTDGVLVELRPVRYEFPGIAGAGADDWDANWLVIRGDVRLADGREWQFQDPSLTTWEAAELADWLRAVAAGAVKVRPFPVDEDDLLAFTEPNLAFSLAATSEGKRTVRVHFSLEVRPPWVAARTDERDHFAFFVAVDTTAAELTRAADAWDREQASFPPR